MEGPSLVILAEELAPIVGREIIGVSGNTKTEIASFEGKIVKSVRSWGKHLLIELDHLSIRIHFLLFGSYRINERKENREPRLQLLLQDFEINFYACSVRLIEEKLEKVYDWRIDTMSPLWDEKYVQKKVKLQQDQMVCDVLMNQDIFAGVGNIIKNEVLFNVQLHPEALVKDLKLARLKAMVAETRSYCFKFFEWKKLYELRKNWLAYKKRKCRRCGVPLLSQKTGKGQRRSYYCTMCQYKA